jgi:hypothetical protein
MEVVGWKVELKLLSGGAATGAFICATILPQPASDTCAYIALAAGFTAFLFNMIGG